jgi:hypothetical protein
MRSDTKVRFTCPVHASFEVGCDEVVIDVFDVYVPCEAGCMVTKKVNPIVARRLRASGAREGAAALALEARDYLAAQEESLRRNREAGIDVP